MDICLRVELPLPLDRALNPNCGVANRFVVAAARRRARTMAMLEAKRMLRAYGMSAADCARFNRYSLMWCWCGHCCDDDNALARCKSYKDGCCDAMRIDDRQLQCADIRLQEVPRMKERKVVLRFWQEEEKPDDFELVAQ